MARVHDGPHDVKRALVVRHHVEDDAGLIGRALVRRGYQLETTLIDATHPSPTSWEADVVVVLGANSSVYDSEVQERWLNAELNALHEIANAQVPILGICFGAQMLCHLFGGTVQRAANEEVGWFDVEVVADVALPRGPWFEHHHDCCTLPPTAEIWARTALAVQAFAIGRHVGVQFHPEIEEEQLARWFASTSDVGRASSERESALLAETRRQTPSAAVRAQQLVDLFLRHGAVDHNR